MELPDVETSHQHALKMVKSFFSDLRGNEPLPKDLVNTLRVIAEKRLDTNQTMRFDSMYEQTAKGILKTNTAMVSELGSKLRIEQAVDIYDNAITDILKANGYRAGRCAG